MFSDLWSKEETPKHSNEKRKLQKPCYPTLRSNKDTCWIFKKAIQQDALILRNILQKAYNSGLFAYVTISPSLSVRCETNKPPAMRVRIEGTVGLF